MKKYKSKIITGIIFAIVLAFVFWYGGDAPGLRGWISESGQPSDTIQNHELPNKEITENTHSLTETNERPKNENKNFESSRETQAVINKVTEKGKDITASLPGDSPTSIKSENSVITAKELTCTLSVRCDTILNDPTWLNTKKTDIIPNDGVIFAEKTVTFYEGESVFNLLVREMKRNNIHMEFENIPIYNSAYIEGIANIYEFDCGELSGWMYKVNDWFPNFGCSRYRLEDGDRVEWVYTCNLGVDVGGNYSARNGN